MPTAITKRVNLSSIDGLYATLRKIDPEAKAELRDACVAIADRVVMRAQSNALQMQARHGMGFWRYLGPTIRSRRGTVPTVMMGSKSAIPGRKQGRVAARSQSVGDPMMGAEFGQDALGRPQRGHGQFLPWKGNPTTYESPGYVFWPAWRALQQWSLDTYINALTKGVDDAARRSAHIPSSSVKR